MRALRPDRLVSDGGRLWVIDQTQPVALVVTDDAEPRLVSWAALPPAPIGDEGGGRSVEAGGGDVYVQECRGGPVARLGADGIERVWWVDPGLRLEAAGPDGAWLTHPRPDQWLLTPARLIELGAPTDVAAGQAVVIRRPTEDHRAFSVVQCGEDGRLDTVDLDGQVVWLRSGPEGLDMELDGRGSRVSVWLRSFSDYSDEVDAEPQTVWVRRGWDGGELTEIPAGVAEDVTAGWSTPWIRLGGEWQPPVVADGLRWRAGRLADDPGIDEAAVSTASDDAAASFGWFAYVPTSGQTLGPDTAVPPEVVEALANADQPNVAAEDDEWPETPTEHECAVVLHDADGSFVRRWDLGPGDITARVAHDGGLAVVLVRGEESSVVHVRPSEADPVELLGNIDITTACRPLVTRPLEAEAYEAEMLRRHSALTWGVENGAACLAGEWPATCIEWTFTHASRPGLRLRRRLSLYDEFGRLLGDGGESPLAYAEIHLVEDIETGHVPAARDAVEGVLDV